MSREERSVVTAAEDISLTKTSLLSIISGVTGSITVSREAGGVTVGTGVLTASFGCCEAAALGT